MMIDTVLVQYQIQTQTSTSMYQLHSHPATMPIWLQFHYEQETSRRQLLSLFDCFFVVDIVGKVQKYIDE